VKVTNTSAVNFLSNHPEEGTMLAYSEALDHFKIRNAVAKITAQEIVDFPTPLIAFRNENGGIFTVIKSFTDNTIVWLNSKNKWKKTKLEDFTQDWSGIVLFAEIDESSGERGFSSKRRTEILKNSRIPIAIAMISILLLVLLVQIDSITPVTYSFLFLKIIGIILTSLLFLKSIGLNNELVSKLCYTRSFRDCQSILDSPASKITRWFSWADAGFIYFVGSLFSIFLFLDSPENLKGFLTFQLLWSSLAIAFSAYSLYYQGLKAKMWCALCLGVVSLFILEASLIFINFSFDNVVMSVQTIVKVVFAFVAPITFLLLFKGVLMKSLKAERLEKELNKLKTNPKIFESLLKGQKEMPRIPEDMLLVSLGTKRAQHTLTMVSNPLCSPCSEMHSKIENLLEKDDNIKCEVIFSTKKNYGNVGGRFIRKLFSLPEKLRSEAVAIWFEQNNKNFDRWNEFYKKFDELDYGQNIQDSHNSWVNSAKIKHTPTLFINGKFLPDVFKIEDLSLHLTNTKPWTFSKMDLQIT
jgi:uncharacterized membrane protein